MPEWRYSVTDLDPERTVKCSGRELRISAKATTEICRTIRGMKLSDAKELLEEVTRLQRPIAYRRYKKEVAHRALRERLHAGKFPAKAAAKILFLLEELEANAEYKGLDPEKIRIIHAASQRGMKIVKYIPRAFGRSSPYLQETTHVELIGLEAG